MALYAEKLLVSVDRRAAVACIQISAFDMLLTLLTA